MRAGTTTAWTVAGLVLLGLLVTAATLLTAGRDASRTGEDVLAGGPEASASAPGTVSNDVAPVEPGPRTYYIAPDGDDAADGSRERPWRTAIRASRSLQPGDTLLARGGTYVGQGGYGWAASGTADAPIRFAEAPDEEVVFDGGGLEQWIILRNVEHLVVEGFEITNYHPIQNGVLLVIGTSSDIVLEDLVMRGMVSAAEPGSALEHLIYPGAGPVTNLTIRDCLLDASGLGGAAIHVFHDPGPRDLLIENNDIRNGYWGIIIGSTADGVTIRDNRFSGNRQDVEVADIASDVSVEP